MNKKISLGLAISLMAVIATLAIMLTYSYAINVFEDRMAAITDREATGELITEIDNKIRQKYSGTISESKLRSAIANGYVTGLGDADCAYFSSEQWELEDDRKAGYDFGLGMDVTKTSDGNMMVTRVQSGSPSSKAGVRKGDIIYRLGDKKISSMGYDKAVAAIAAEPTSVSLRIERDGTKLSDALSLTKSRFTIASVEYSMPDKNIGSIIIYSFNDMTPEQFNTALGKLQRDKIEGLIIDLRGCTGGSYAAACEILDTLLPSGRLMLLTDKSGEQTVKYTSDANDVSLKLAVLVDENTAGAAELFASAMYDFTKCDLIGAATKGQLTYQEDFRLSDGSAIRLTTGTWATAKNKQIIDGKVNPTFAVEIKLSSYQKENLRLLTAKEDPQITTALARLRSMIEEDKPVTSAADVSDSDGE